MSLSQRLELFDQESESDSAARKLRTDSPILNELVKVLTPCPDGLRRWSVMRAIRKEREKTGRDIPQKFEDEVERTFRRFCAAACQPKLRSCIDRPAMPGHAPMPRSSRHPAVTMCWSFF